MLIFAIALVPEGNIIRHIAGIGRRVFATGDSPEASALPEGIYLGFFTPGARGKREDLVKSFRRGGEELFSGLPPLLRFETAAREAGRWYIVPQERLSGGIAAAARSIADEAGFSPADCQPLAAGTGFFVANNVTPPRFEVFSFRHLDAVLYGIESADRSFGSAWWRVLARLPRRTGPRGGAAVREKNESPW